MLTLLSDHGRSLLLLCCCAAIFAASDYALSPQPGTFAEAPVLKVLGLQDGQVARYSVDGRVPAANAPVVPPQGLRLANGQHTLKILVYVGETPVGALLEGSYRVGSRAVSARNEQADVASSDGGNRTLGHTVHIISAEEVSHPAVIISEVEGEAPKVELRK